MRATVGKYSCIVKPVAEWHGWLAVCAENGLLSLASTQEAALADLAQKGAYWEALEDATSAAA